MTHSLSSSGCTPPTTRRSACRSRCSGRATTGSRSCATATLWATSNSSSTELEPILARLEFDDLGEATLDTEATGVFLRELMPAAREARRAGAAPAAWVRAPARIRANVSARIGAQSSGLLSTEALASFDWRLAVGDVDLGEAELAELAAAKSPVVRVAGRWQALRQTDVQRALRFLERRKRGGGVVDLVRTVSGLETDEAGLELGDVTLDRSLSELLDGEARFEPLGRHAGMQFDLFRFQERGHGWLRLLGDLGIGAILADDMGLGKTVQAIAMLLSEREESAASARADARRLPDERRTTVGGRDRALRAVAARAPASRQRPLADEALLIGKVRNVDVVVTSYDIVTRDVDTLPRVAWDRRAARRGAGREEPGDEARALAAPADARAGASR